MTTTNDNADLARAILTVETPHLKAPERLALCTALMATASGAAKVLVAVTYHKVTKTAPRIEGTHYLGLPGTTPTLHLGEITKVALNKAGDLYFLVADTARGDGTAPAGWTALKPAGLRTFQVRALTPLATPAPV